MHALELRKTTQTVTQKVDANAQTHLWQDTPTLPTQLNIVQLTRKLENMCHFLYFRKVAEDTPVPKLTVFFVYPGYTHFSCCALNDSG